ncbi:hypothetical protein A2763_01900 [Candidatus Kaiserbacteria bacterium RIFCSPHIGHO2_01_FULL_54_36]|nr:MAG: hypothetical protein A2763_01900 [Candidatus Kaiserbacteria bacterium RIFCSPHIGHO2_01_FULL_54_36]OGG75295.1 MAG: hypothetical protein A3A41_01255 [Candidatus Kaiserbacteria bacterium RIFCSPLOWO2_01_FULL_54_22]
MSKRGWCRFCGAILMLTGFICMLTLWWQWRVELWVVTTEDKVLICGLLGIGLVLLLVSVDWKKFNADNQVGQVKAGAEIAPVVPDKNAPKT